MGGMARIAVTPLIERRFVRDPFALARAAGYYRRAAAISPPSRSASAAHARATGSSLDADELRAAVPSRFGDRLAAASGRRGRRAGDSVVELSRRSAAPFLAVDDDGRRV